MKILQRIWDTTGDIWHSPSDLRGSINQEFPAEFGCAVELWFLFSCLWNPISDTNEGWQDC